MKAKTAELWAKQHQHQGDRWRFFSAVGQTIEADTVLYPGSDVDLAPSFVFGSVTNLDLDKRVPGFFADTEGVAELIAQPSWLSCAPKCWGSSIESSSSAAIQSRYSWFVVWSSISATG